MNQSIKKIIPFSKPSIGPEEEAAVLSVLKSGWLTTGPEAVQFERDFARFVHSPFALCVNSGTAGLHLSLHALKVKSGSYVITTPYTFAATSESILYLNSIPCFVDIEESSYNISPLLIEAAISKLKKEKKNIACILPVHIGGLPCQMDSICAISEQYDIPVVEDAAHAFPVKYNNRYVGTFGKTGVFSFYANKTITTGEGGMVVTEDESLAKKIRILRLHGMDRESWDRYTSNHSDWSYDIVEAGFKYNMQDIAAAIGRIQLDKANSLLKKRESIAKQYFKALSDYDFLKLPEFTKNHAWHLFLLKLVPDKLNLTRDEFIIKLREKGIGTAVHFIPLHIMSYYKREFNFKGDDFPVALSNYQKTISLPIYPDLKENEVDYIVRSIIKTGKKHYKQSCLYSS